MRSGMCASIRRREFQPVWFVPQPLRMGRAGGEFKRDLASMRRQRSAWQQQSAADRVAPPDGTGSPQDITASVLPPVAYALRAPPHTLCAPCAPRR